MVLRYATALGHLQEEVPHRLDIQPRADWLTDVALYVLACFVGPDVPAMLPGHGEEASRERVLHAALRLSNL